MNFKKMPLTRSQTTSLFNSPISPSNVTLMTVTPPKTLDEMPNSMRCPCGGGQSCIADRRWLGDVVMEDILFDNNNISRRVNCLTPFTTRQLKIITDNLDS